MFQTVKGFKKEDLKVVAEEIGEIVSSNITVAGLKKLILESEEFKTDPVFVQDILSSTIENRKMKEITLEKEKELALEMEKAKMEMEKAKMDQEKAKMDQEKAKMDHELELARLQAQHRENQGEFIAPNFISEVSNSKRKFTLPKLEFRQFGDDVKDWLPFWSQFEQIHKDEEIALEDKFQYLIQATVAGSRAREVVESFPPTGANYTKAVDSLKTRFGREDILVEVYVRELLKLIISVQTKEKFSLTHLYDKLESYLRALETLGVTTDVNASILYPMVESCFPVEFLKAWNRSNISSSKYDAKERLKNLMEFLKIEVEGEERISLAVAGFGLGKSQDNKSQDNKHFKKKTCCSDHLRNKIPTAAGLLTTTSTAEVKKSCIFCEGRHMSSECFSAQKMSLTERQKIVKDKRRCFACLAAGHTINRCRAILRCLICSKKHVPLMCDSLHPQQNPAQKKEETVVEKEMNMSNFSKRNPKVFLQTLKAKLISADKEKTVRLLLDSASHKSYILKSVAKKMNYSPVRQERLVHSLFGGISSKEILHDCYKIKLSNLNKHFSCNFEVMDQTKICDNIQPVCPGSWIKELEESNIILTDVSEKNEIIDILVGADVLGKLLTGRTKSLSSGLVATETHLGWTLMGKLPQEETSNEDLAMTVISMYVNEGDISNLWKLDLLGITDPVERKSKYEIDIQTKEHFLETVTINSDGRYEVCLPWDDDNSPLPDNLNLAKKRLDYTTSKLNSMNLYHKYEDVFISWLDEGIIEEVPQSQILNYGNYLPHRPVIKLSSSTTPIRPVFDASARLPNHPSLNQCLQCGPNLIELLPNLILRFRERKFGLLADIRKAFCQISIRQEDREFLRFLWWENLEEKKLKIFRHTRVVFGINCSPFLLASVIEYHIKNNKEYDEVFKERLAESFYVDNIVTSVESEGELRNFIHDATTLMSKGGFELRDWEYSGDCDTMNGKKDIHVLGLIWNKEWDTLNINMNWVDNFNIEKVTKRGMTSLVHKVFDPFGFVSPVMLSPKIMLQKVWKKGISWDEDINCELRKDFLQWFQELKLLRDVKIPRWIQITEESKSKCTVHTFVDGSQDAYAAMTVLRIADDDKIEIFLLAAKSRVAPLRGATIPRMELLAAVIGARLANSIVEALQWETVKKYFWSDSTTVLAWISREENWSVFVRNRVKEIRCLSDPLSWKHVPGEKNPADLPSRGCKAKHFISSKWWEGPQWMKNPIEYNNLMYSSHNNWDEDEIRMEKSKSSCILVTNQMGNNNDWYYRYFSSYQNIVRLIGWIYRFKHNCLNPKDRRLRELTAAEFQKAESKVIYMIQKESFTLESDDKLKTLQTFKDEQGVIRLKTKITYRKDEEDFLKPAVLPATHEVVKRLIMYTHKRNCHAGVQILLNLLRERYWILQGRKTVKRVLNDCVVCKRFSSKNIETLTSPLPENRVKDAAVFQITGVDMAGPLFLKDNKKGWVLIFTCAVYRAVHFELVTSASTDAFLMAFRRFVARRGRCSTVYCDNGTNFVGAANSLKQLDWDRIQKHGAVNAIEWRFNPPTACWWGGWWERLIRIMKDLLKRVLGRASLNYEEMTTILADSESVINSRPLTYITEDEAIKPISPSMFIQDIQEYKLPDIDAIDQKSLTKRVKYRQALHKSLRNRFRSEYLGTLIQRGCRKQPNKVVSVGDIVLIGSDNKKRINWPLGRISELISGKDGKVRLVKVQTSQQELLRPIQRIYPLEIASSDNVYVPMLPENLKKSKDISKTCDFTSDDVMKFSSFGRRIKVPEKLHL